MTRLKRLSPLSRAGRDFSPYIVKDSNKTLNEILADTNTIVYNAHGPDYRLSGQAARIIVDPLYRYEHLLRGLAESPLIDCAPFRELLRAPGPADRVRCGIRHDVDIDIRAALSQAEIEAEYGIRTTFFILHTAPYYGAFMGGVFYRHGCMAYIYRRIQDLGHEIALHTDALLIYQRFGIDGASALRQEIEWLRSEGLEIVGTTAHGSAAVYGVENYAIFNGRSHKLPSILESGLNNRSAKHGNTEYEYQGKRIPLGVLEETELGLVYEANDVFWQKEVPVEYGALRGANAWRWNRHLRRWSGMKRPTDRQFYDQDRLLKDIGSLDPGRFLILVVHPVYYGARHSANSGPARRIDQRSTIINKQLGWETYEPRTIQARSGGADQRQEFQAINMSNERGMLDRPQFGHPQSNEIRLVVFGGKNVDGSSVTTEAHMHLVLRELIEGQSKRPTKAWKFAFPGMGFTRHYGWYQAVTREIAPHVVVIGIGADEIGLSLPEGWAELTGFRPAYPPGDYLHWNGTAVEIVKGSKHALAHRRKPTGVNAWPSLTQAEGHWPGPNTVNIVKSYLLKCLMFFADTIRKDGGAPIILIQEAGEGIGLWDADAHDKARKAGHAQLMRFVREAASAARVPVIDPYRLFFEQPRDLAPHWRSTPEWNYTGHRLAAEEACKVIMAACIENLNNGAELNG